MLPLIRVHKCEGHFALGRSRPAVELSGPGVQNTAQRVPPRPRRTFEPKWTYWHETRYVNQDVGETLAKLPPLPDVRRLFYRRYTSTRLRCV